MCRVWVLDGGGKGDGEGVALVDEVLGFGRGEGECAAVCVDASVAEDELAQVAGPPLSYRVGSASRGECCSGGGVVVKVLGVSDGSGEAFGGGGVLGIDSGQEVD